MPSRGNSLLLAGADLYVGTGGGGIAGGAGGAVMESKGGALGIGAFGCARQCG